MSIAEKFSQEVELFKKRNAETTERWNFFSTIVFKEIDEFNNFIVKNKLTVTKRSEKVPCPQIKKDELPKLGFDHPFIFPLASWNIADGNGFTLELNRDEKYNFNYVMNWKENGKPMRFISAEHQAIFDKIGCFFARKISEDHI